MDVNEDINQFKGVTGASTEAAKSFLEGAGGDVAAAVDAFYAGDGPESTRDASAQDPPQTSVAAAGQPAPAAARRSAQASVTGRRKVRGLADLGAGTDDSEEDESNEYYAGGEKSGQVVKGGDGKGTNQVESLFDRARQAGAGVGSSADLQPAKGLPFQGTARTIGGGDQESRPANPNSSAQPNQPTLHTITFWANNVFTVNDGEPRDVTDPANRPFLEAISRGECPHELTPAVPNTPININMVRSGQPYTPPAQPRHVAFSGRGQSLAGSSRSAEPASTRQDAGTGKTWEGVDEAKPTSSIQLRLHDGSRLVARFNHDQTVGDIRRFIAASRPDMPAGYNLMTAFPQMQLTDDTKTISESGLLGAVIIQKL